MWLLFLQIGLLIAWYAVPWLVAVPWWVIWSPMLLLALSHLLMAVGNYVDHRRDNDS